MGYYWLTFTELLATPFHHVELVWGIVPLYFAWIFNELTSAKRSFRTAVQTGFSFLWCGAHWTWQYLAAIPHPERHLTLDALLAVNVMVTILVVLIGIVALDGSFVGHTRFGNYFMIAIFPIQSRYLDWSWDRLLTILIFAVPIWGVLQLGLMPVRK